MSDRPIHPAYMLALACFMHNLTLGNFLRLSMQAKLSFAEGNAGLSQDQLIQAVEMIGQLASRQSTVRRQHLESRGHA